MFPPSAMYNQAPAAHPTSASEPDAGDDQQGGEPIGAPVFASLSRDESAVPDRSNAGAADDEERSKTPTIGSTTPVVSDEGGSAEAEAAA